MDQRRRFESYLCRLRRQLLCPMKKPHLVRIGKDAPGRVRDKSQVRRQVRLEMRIIAEHPTICWEKKTRIRQISQRGTKKRETKPSALNC